MLKTRKLISLVLVVAMMLSVFSVAIVSTGAAEAVESATIVYDGQTVNAHVGDTIRYKAYMDVTPISTASDGYVNGVNAVTYYTQSNLTISGTLGRKNFPNLYAPTIGTDVEGAIYYNDVDIDEGFKYDADSPVLIDVTFEITQGGTSTITNNIIELYKAENNVPKYFYYAEGEKLIDETPNFWSTLEVTCPHPDEPTVAPTDAPTPGDKLTVTVVSLDGVEDTKTFDIGETFTVYTTLNTSAYENGGISALNGSQ
uniref:hypothetical protein n=1 Tax=Ruminococcus sp. TaxID=41978 RepID=UPI00386BB5CE